MENKTLCEFFDYLLWFQDERGHPGDDIDRAAQALIDGLREAAKKDRSRPIGSSPISPRATR